MDIEEIYNIYFKDVYVYIYGFTKDSSLAEDITQETFIKAMKHIHSYDGRKDIRAWLFTIAKNTYYTHYNRQKKLTSYDSKQEETACDNKDILDSLIKEEQAIAIHRYVHAMKEPYKEVFSLRVFGELSFEKIGFIFGKSAGWARVTFYRAKKEILEKMEAANHE